MDLTLPPTVTDRAFDRLAEINADGDAAKALRVAVEGGGCSGFQYKFEMAEGPDSEDSVSETDGVQLVVDPVSLDLLEGSVVDYVESLGGAAFRVENPNASAGCGCGSSFGI